MSKSSRVTSLEVLTILSLVLTVAQSAIAGEVPAPVPDADELQHFSYK
ncbi:hypothetical protein Osc7112_6495 (plasmid) [Oscillatoria nigro-viridis PCC 7112]|uniref:Uncharacterized protein n=1 Tax=Phormidium nigroviride PCC 7112 TaxID=179408 RepID=K9VT22_9CYAN|nr:hypothetical protein Osc7112_6495 [Oscillatoria nigro-viridis PCC 7112]